MKAIRLAVIFTAIFLYGFTKVNIAQEPPKSPLQAVPYGYDVLLNLLPLTEEKLWDEGVSQENQTTATAEYRTWSRIVFQSYQNDNWDIFIADGNGNNRQQLTHHTGNDVQPHLNRGGTRIVFSSENNHNYKIFSMDPDGNDIRQLTFNDTDDFWPKWSPDGNKIVFQSYQNDTPQIFVMNADGSNLTQLTFDSGGAIHPSWHPDGTKIIFAANRGGNEAIWVMNADGSEPHQVGPAQPLTGHPVWSPDGSRIAFQAQERWHEYDTTSIWVMNADGTELREVDAPSSRSSELLFLTSWSPDGRYLTETFINLSSPGSNYWVASSMYTLDTTFYLDREELPNSSRDWYPVWQTLDVKSPTVKMGSIAEYTHYRKMKVSWSGTDDLSGIINFDVQYKKNQQDWTDLLTKTTAISSTIDGKIGDQFQFRVRARDASYNLSDWTESDSTQLYVSLISRIKDTRGIPLPDAQVSISPVSDEYIEQKSPGEYFARLTYEDVEISITNPNFGPFPETEQHIQRDEVKDFYLPPVDNVIQNGGFESGLDHWLVSGQFSPIITNTYYHSGKSSIHLGHSSVSDQLTEPETVPLERMPLNLNAVADSFGNVHLLYYDAPWGQPGAIYHIQRNRDGSWGEVSKVGEVSSSDIYSSMAADSEGNVYAAWSTGSAVVFRSLSHDGIWFEETIIDSGQKANVFVDSQDGLHIVYNTNSGTYYRYRSPDGIWHEDEYIGELGLPDILVDQNGTVHITWQDSVYVMEGFYGYYDSRILYRYRPKGGNWSTPEVIYDGRAYSILARKTVLDSEGTIHLVASVNDSGSGIYMYRPKTEARWSRPLSFGWQDFRQASLSVDSAGNLYLIGSANSGSYYYRKPFNQEWEFVQKLSDLATGIITIDIGDNLHLIYPGSWANYSYQGSVTASQSGFSEIKQGFTLPSNMHNMTLAFLYRLSGLRMGDRGKFQMLVSDGLTSTTVLSDTISKPVWSHTWIDMHDWAGKTITLTILLESYENEPYAEAYLDEISLGSWNTPVPQSISPNRVDEKSNGVEITVTGENFIAIPSDEGNGTGSIDSTPIVWPSIYLNNILLPDARLVNSTTLTATLPTTLPVGVYDVFVTNPTGQSSGIGHGLTVVGYSYLPIIFR